jgi:hypothetical protein
MNDSVAQQAMTHLTNAYTDAESRAGAVGVVANLGGTTITPGLYGSTGGGFTIDGTLTPSADTWGANRPN